MLIPPNASKDARYRLGRFANWLSTHGLQWRQPDLARYRDEMLGTYAPATVSAHLSTIRARYREIIRDNGTLDALYALASQQLSHVGKDDTPANRKAYVDELLTRIDNAIDPRASAVKVKAPHSPEGERIRLTAEQADALPAAPGVEPLAGLRDTAVIALMLCTGIREAELCALEVRDLRQKLNGVLALHVCKVKAGWFISRLSQGNTFGAARPAIKSPVYITTLHKWSFL